MNTKTYENRPKRSSPRGQLFIESLSIGKDIKGFKSPINFAPEYEVNDLINKLVEGPKVVSLPIPPNERHAFLIDVQPNKIMVSDWGGIKNKTLGILGSKKYEYGWEQYSDLLKKLEETYKRPIEYYPIDKNLEKEANKYNIECNGGGCSYYIYKWLKVYYSNYIS